MVMTETITPGDQPISALWRLLARADRTDAIASHLDDICGEIFPSAAALHAAACGLVGRWLADVGAAREVAFMSYRSMPTVVREFRSAQDLGEHMACSIRRDSLDAIAIGLHVFQPNIPAMPSGEPNAYQVTTVERGGITFVTTWDLQSVNTDGKSAAVAVTEQRTGRTLLGGTIFGC